MLRAFFLNLLLLFMFCSAGRKSPLYTVLDVLDNLYDDTAHDLMLIETSQNTSRIQKRAAMNALINAQTDKKQKNYVHDMRFYFDLREDSEKRILSFAVEKLHPTAREVGKQILDIFSADFLSPMEIEDKVSSVLKAASVKIQDELERASKDLEDKFSAKKTFAEAAILHRHYTYIPKFTAHL